MIDKQTVCHQFAVAIPRGCLPSLLQELVSRRSEYSDFRLAFCFDLGDRYEVVVNEYGHHYPFQVSMIQDFIRELKT